MIDDLNKLLIYYKTESSSLLLSSSIFSSFLTLIENSPLAVERPPSASDLNLSSASICLANSYWVSFRLSMSALITFVVLVRVAKNSSINWWISVVKAGNCVCVTWSVLLYPATDTKLDWCGTKCLGSLSESKLNLVSFARLLTSCIVSYSMSSTETQYLIFCWYGVMHEFKISWVSFETSFPADAYIF